MKCFTKLLVVSLLYVLSISTSALAGATDPLFINLTSDDSHRANMAISFGGNQHARGHQLTMFLNDKGVLLASTASDQYSAHQKMLADLVTKGATVLVCPMCMKHFGIEKSDLVEGLTVGNPDLTGSMLFKDNTKTLTW